MHLFQFMELIDFHNLFFHTHFLWLMVTGPIRISVVDFNSVSPVTGTFSEGNNFHILPSVMITVVLNIPIFKKTNKNRP